jgi:hypothetical protein
MITQPDEIQITLDSISHLLCYGDSAGVIHVSATGGVGSYSYIWNNGDSIAQITQLPAGNYELTLTDDHGCTMVFEDDITQPDSLDLFSSIGPATCSNGSNGNISNQMSGGVSPYNYLWSDGATGSFRGGLDTGLYEVTVTDANGCTYLRTYEVGYQNEAPNADLGDSTGFCEGDSVLLMPNTFGTFSWSTGSTDSSIYVSAIGFYSVTATGNGCQDIDTLYVDEYELPEVDLGNDTMMCIADLEEGFILAGPTGMAQYSWSTGGVDSTEAVSAFGTYWLLVENSFGCTAIDSIEVVSDTCLGVDDILSSMWNVFPNPTRGLLTIETKHSVQEHTHLVLYNSAGQAVLKEGINRNLNPIELSAIAAGIYYLEIRNEGVLLYREKIIVN